MTNMETYGAISFSGETKAGPFYDQIWSGRKRQTMRKPRKDERPHVKPGYAFKMYWKVRQPKQSKPVHYIGMAMCTKYRLIKIIDVWNLLGEALSDGFLDLEEFRDWFFPEWRNLSWLDRVIEAYWNLRAREMSTKFLLPWAYKTGKFKIAKFLELEYMVIKWSWPLLQRGKLSSGLT